VAILMTAWNATFELSNSMASGWGDFIKILKLLSRISFIFWKNEQQL